MNNIPTITPKTENMIEPKSRPIVRARDRDVLHEANVNIDPLIASTDMMEVEYEYVSNDDKTAQEDSELPSNTSSGTLASENDALRAEVRIPLQENAKLKAEKAQSDTEIACLLSIIEKFEFSFDKYKDDIKLFKFYTGLPDFATFRIIFDLFGPATKALVYHNSNTNIEKLKSPEHKKCGRKRTLSP